MVAATVFIASTTRTHGRVEKRALDSSGLLSYQFLFSSVGVAEKMASSAYQLMPALRRSACFAARARRAPFSIASSVMEAQAASKAASGVRGAE